MSMEEWTGFSVPEPILEEASQWIVKLDTNDITEQQRICFTVWLASDPLHQTAYAELSDLWARTSVIKRFSDHVEHSNLIGANLSVVNSSQSISVQNEQTVWPRFVSMSFITIGFLFPAISPLI